MPDKDAIEDAWKIHGAVTDWTGKVDAKAAFVLTIESAVITAVLVGRGEGQQLATLVGLWRGIALGAGLLALGVSVVLAAMVVVPNIRRSRVSVESSSNWIFFGHLKEGWLLDPWSPGWAPGSTARCGSLVGCGRTVRSGRVRQSVEPAESVQE